MKPITLLVAALVLVVGVGLVVTGGPVPGQTAFAAGHPLPEATKKKTPKAKPSATPTTATPSPIATRRPIDEEGERWVQLAVVGGGGLLACVLAFFGVGYLMRRRTRARVRGGS
jgi:small neutral amino acid transporter SnatA (MarC family)